eukprot:2781727-Pleurochrysis_carterae.AAC.1
MQIRSARSRRSPELPVHAHTFSHQRTRARQHIRSSVGVKLSTITGAYPRTRPRPRTIMLARRHARAHASPLAASRCDLSSPLLSLLTLACSSLS